jgi:hypothetical protein
MGVKKHVFGSNAEREVWAKLRRRWGDKYSIYPNLPFLNVVDAKPLLNGSGNRRITEQEFNWLKKTSIDFTLCDEHDAPLVCVEFDGMQDGFNTGIKYRAADPTDPWRDTILSLKLKVAHGFKFPFFVVGSKEFRDISEAMQVCIVDTIIGDVLAGNAIAERASQFDPADIGMTSEEFERISPDDQYELVQDWFIGVEADADVTYNPVFAAVGNLWEELTPRLGPMRSFKRFVHQPSLDDAQTPRERYERMEKAILHGAECTLTTQQYGEVTGTVWLPNFKTPGFSEYGFLPELAELAALEAVRRRAAART